LKNKLCFILCQDKAFEDKMNCQFQRVSSGATKSDLEPSVSTTDTQQNIEPPYPDIAKLTAMDDTVKRKLLSSKWNDYNNRCANLILCNTCMIIIYNNIIQN
jgi:hypothetical protein